MKKETKKQRERRLKVMEDLKNHKQRMKKFKEAKIFKEESKNPLDQLFN